MPYIDLTLRGLHSSFPPGWLVGWLVCFTLWVGCLGCLCLCVCVIHSASELCVVKASQICCTEGPRSQILVSTAVGGSYYITSPYSVDKRGRITNFTKGLKN
jgi:hypothetical protein